MKTTRYMFMAMALGSLMLGRAYADEPSKRASEQDSRGKLAPSDRPPAHSLLPEKSSGIVPLNAPVKHAPGSEFHPFVLKKPAPAANGVLIKTKTENHPAQLARLPAGSGASAPKPVIVLARSSTVTALGGVSSASAKHSSAMVDGAAFKPKP